MERTHCHQYLHRPGRGERHSAAESQSRCHYSHQGIFLCAPCGEEGAGRTARHYLYTTPLYQGHKKSIRLRGAGNEGLGAWRNVSRIRQIRLHGLRKDRYGTEPWSRPLGVYGICADGQSQDSRGGVCRERRMGRRLRSAPWWTDNGTVYSRKAVGAADEEGRRIPA